MHPLIRVLVSSLILPLVLHAELRLPSILSDHMVLQQNHPLPIWGWAEPGAQVEVSFDGKMLKTVAAEDGSWKVVFPAKQADGAVHTLNIRSGDETLTLRDLLLGEVWLCSGQSNMDWSIAQSGGLKKALAQADLPQLRLYRVPRTIAHTPQDAIQGRWQASTPETALGFTAVGWNFGREIHQSQQVPVGLIHVAWGGTYVETWTPMETLEGFDFMTPRIALYRESLALPDTSDEEKQQLKARHQQLKFLKDPGNRGFFFGWHQTKFNDEEWQIQQLPGKLEELQGPMDGAVWYRKSVLVPEDWAGENLLLRLGPIDDFDETYVNGTLVGTTGLETPQFYAHPREYLIPAGIIKKGEPIQLAIRVFDHFGQGGIFGKKEQLSIRPASKPETPALSLAGAWKTRVELRQLQLQSAPLVKTLELNPNQPSVLYKGMIHHLIPFPLQGVLWYQGESNSGRPQEYHQLFPALINSWRQVWDNPDMEFYYVQLANYKALQTKPVEGGWAWIREAQQSALALPRTAEAVILDVGDAEDIHPADKATPAHRLARHARALVYGEEIPHQHPRYVEEQRLADGSVELTFSGTYEGLSTRDGKAPVGFAVQAQGQEWVWGEATLTAPNKIRITHPMQKPIEAIRYGWATNPVGNLQNSIGNPMTSFRTDSTP